MPRGIYIRTEEHKRKMSEYHKKIPLPKGMSRLGKECSEVTRKKIGLKNSIKLLGKILSKKHKENIRRGLMGHTISNETRKKLSGEKNWNWKGGVTPINQQLRHSFEYKLWRKAVFERDKYTCIWCGIRGEIGRRVELNADHIKPFSLFPELRFAIDNGRTLCVDCHKKTDTYGRSS